MTIAEIETAGLTTGMKKVFDTARDWLVGSHLEKSGVLGSSRRKLEENMTSQTVNTSKLQRKKLKTGTPKSEYSSIALKSNETDSRAHSLSENNSLLKYFPKK